MLKILLTALIVAQTAVAAPQPPIPARPKLVLMLVFDQFRADYLTRFATRFKAAQKGSDVGGFRYLMERGAYYPLAEYGVLQSMTCVGHATVLTGSFPYQNGIAINDWFDRAENRPVYCVEDPKHQLVGASNPKNAKGTSPMRLRASTVGDEMKNAGFNSKVVTVSLKDRSAILMGGRRADLALWWDVKSGHWISSDFYLPGGKLPGWVEKLNSSIDARKDEKLEWLLSEDKPTGFSSEDSAVTDERTFKMGTQFPHSAKVGSKSALSLPYGADRTTEAAELAIENFKLGQSEHTDLLAVSYSGHDYLGHAFGPNSRELEELTVYEDRSISHLLNTVAKKVPGGLKNVTIVLTADHGIPSNPDWLKKGRTDAGRVDERALKDKLNELLNDEFGKPSGEASWIVELGEMNIYLNHSLIVKKGADQSAMERRLKTYLLKLPETAFVLTSTEYTERRLPPGLHGKQVMNTYIPGKSGDLVIIPRPNFMVGNDTTTHHTGYAYDRFVPLVLTGHGVRPGRFAEHAEVVDIAPTLAFILGIVPPNMSEGRVLSEALLAGPGKF